MRAVLLALCLAACRHRSAPVLVDGTLPFGSREGLMARFVREGYDLAFEEAGSGWRLDLADDGGDPARGVESMRRSPARFHLGSSSPEVADAQAAFAAAEGRPYLDGLHISGEQLAITQMRWIDELRRSGRLPTPVALAVLVEDGARGAAFGRAVARMAGENAAIRIAYQGTFPAGEQDFTRALSEVRATAADVFLSDESLNEFMVLHQQYRLRGLCHRLAAYGPHGAELQSLEAFGFDGLAYLASAVPWTWRLARSPASRRFLASFKNAYRREPDWQGALAYEAARRLIEAIRAAGPDPSKVRAALATTSRESILSTEPLVIQQHLPDGTTPVVFPASVAESEALTATPKCN